MSRSPVIAILEDDHGRRMEMFQLLDDRLPWYRVVFHRTAGETIDWLNETEDTILLLSLDHDLHDLEADDPQEREAAGCGRDVVDWLTDPQHDGRFETRFPILVHTSNAPAGLGMTERLRELGWPYARVQPYDDLAWIRELWYPSLKRSIPVVAVKPAVTKTSH